MTSSIYRVLCWLALVAALVWVYWSPMVELSSRWSADPSYSHGFLVPLFSIYLLWRRRTMAGASSPAVGWAVLFLALGTLLQLAASVLLIRTLTHYSLPFFIASVCLGLWGWNGMKWAWPSILFLFFMVPLPGPTADLLAHPLQRVATKASTYAIQVLGVPAVEEGNVILLSEGRIGVAEACSGLRMLVLFMTLAAGAVFLVDRRPWEKILVLASAVPIAVVANVARISLTATIYEWGSAELADRVFHDLAGWMMMPLAILLIAAELCLLSALMLVVPPSAPLALDIEMAVKNGPFRSATPRNDAKRSPGVAKRR
ncbi:MAG TPA: exosortase/archaeosortase family protein [Pirellulales bacterium]|nr:exosortase/archaeosortase family protein [Pirellulales bacterium]